MSTKGQQVVRDTGNRLSWAALVLLAFSLPFELDRPLWQIGPLAVTNVEALLLLTLAATAVSLFYSPGQADPPGFLNRYHGWLALFVGGLLLATLLAPQQQGNALKAALRLISGMLLALAVWQTVRRPGDGRIISGALVLAGLMAAAIGWWEISQSELAWAGLFRSHITRVGSFLRLTGTFDYANQAAMFIEATLPFLLAAAWAVNRSHWPRRVKYPLLALLLLLTLLYLQAGVLTLSRASFATIILVCLLLAAWLAVRQPARSRQMALWWVGLAGVTAVLTIGNTLLSSQFRLRLQDGNVDEWYRTHIVVPPTLSIAAGATIEAPVTVTNEGALVWRSQGENPILLGARWIDEAGEQAHGEQRWPFPGPVNPQATVHMNVPVTAPPDPGVYELRWDVVHENVTWFANKSGLFAATRVTVSANEGQTGPVKPAAVVDDRAAWEYAGPVPNRTTLWRVGLQMLRQRPLFGIGLDNYRLTYGDWLGLPYSDTTVHTNNFYLELLVSLGVIGALPFLLWSAGLLTDVLRTLRQPEVGMWQTAVAAGLLAFFIHGFLDFFLLFNATGLLFWLLVGLWISEKKYAHRL